MSQPTPRLLRLPCGCWLWRARGDEYTGTHAAYLAPDYWQPVPIALTPRCYDHFTANDARDGAAIARKAARTAHHGRPATRGR
jgi:hypothetical protein